MEKDLSVSYLSKTTVDWSQLYLGNLTWLTTHVPEPWLLNTPAHVRLLVALPLVLLAEWALNRNWSLVINRLLSDRFIDRAEAQAARVVRKARIYRDSTIVEGLLLVFVLALGIIGLVGYTPLNLDSTHELTAAGIYSKLVSRPLFQFMLFRQLWRWIVWAGLLYGISRIPLTLRPTHPDHCGGIRFLVLPSSSFSIYLAALSVMFSSSWAMQLANGGIKVKDFVPDAVTFVVASLIAALGPLLVFIPQLFQAKRQALAQYGRLAMDYVYRFHQRWIGMKTDDLLGTSDIQSLADLGNAYRVIEESRILIPVWKDAVRAFTVMAIPMLPLLLFEIPLEQLLRRVAKAVFSLPI